MGTITHRGLPEERAVGILKRVESALRAEARLVTALDSAVEQQVFRPYNLEVDADIDPFSIKLHWGPGVVNIFPPGVRLVRTEPMQLSADVFQHLHDVEAEIDEGTLSRSTEGLTETGTYYGYKYATMAGRSSTSMEPIINSFRNLLSQLGSKTLMCLEKVVRSPLHKASPDDVKGFYEVNVVVDTQTPEEKDRRFKIGVDTAMELPWTYRAKEFFGIDDVKGVGAELEADKIMRSGILYQFIAQAVVERMAPEKIAAGVAAQLQGGPSQALPQSVPQGMPQQPQEMDIRKLQRASPMPGQMNSPYEKQTIQRR